MLLFAAGLLAEEEAVAAQVPAVQVAGRRRVPGRLPLQSALLDLWLGGRDEARAWSATPPRRSTPSPAPTPPTCASSPPSSSTRPPSSWCATTARPRGRRRRQPPARGTPSKGVDLVAQRPAARCATPRTPTRWPRPRRPPTASPALRAAGTPAGEMAVLFRINAQSETFEDARCLAGRPVRRPRRGPLLRLGGGPPGRDPALRGTARGGQEDGTVPDLVRATLSGMGWSAEALGTRGETRNRWGVAPGAGGPVDRSSSPSLPEATPRRLRRRPRPPRRRAARAAGRRRHPRHPPRGQGLEWDAVFLCGLQDGTLPITYADTPAAVEEERRLLYVGMTRARRELSISWRSRATPGAGPGPQALAVPRRGGRGRAGGGPSSGPRRNRKAMHCRECGTALSTPAEKKLGRCVDCPASYDEALFERLREWRLERAADDKVLASSSSPTPPCSSPSTGRPTRERCDASAGSVRPSSPSTATTCSRWSPEKSEEILIKSFAHYTGTR